MATQAERMNLFSGKTDNKPWTTPVVEALRIHGALGAAVGTKCDRYGSLSIGTGCPK
jgi:hypothetical protein